MAEEKFNSLSIHEEIIKENKPTRYFIRYLLDIYNFIKNRARWRGIYDEDETYVKNDMVREGPWLMIANKKTTDAPAPTPIGSTDFFLPDAPTWNDLSEADTVLSGMRISGLSKTFSISKIRLWVPNISANAHYRFVVKDNLSGEVAIGSSFNGNAFTSIGWKEVVTSSFIAPGEDKSYYLFSNNSSADTLFNHPWVYTGTTNNDQDPLSGNVNKRNNDQKIRISTTDRDGTDRASELASIIPSSVIRYVSEADLNRFVEFEVITAQDNTTYFIYETTLLDEGSNGIPNEDENIQVYFKVPIQATTDYVELPNFFISNPNIQGAITIGTGSEVYNDNGYGIDIEVQEYIFSPDYDIMSAQ